LVALLESVELNREHGEFFQDYLELCEGCNAETHDTVVVEQGLDGFLYVEEEGVDIIHEKHVDIVEDGLDLFGVVEECLEILWLSLPLLLHYSF
jgi:hypothetical protein